jgi:predicted esterase
LLNGGILTQAARKMEYENADTDAERDANYLRTVEIINGFVAAGDLPDQSALANNAIYISGSDADFMVHPDKTVEQNRYFTDKGAKVSFNIFEGLGHDI